VTQKMRQLSFSPRLVLDYLKISGSVQCTTVVPG
jgi:hypothetical protein